MGKVAVIGVGKLGSCISYEIASRGIAEEIVLIDIYRELAEGNAEDIEQALAFRNNTEVYAGEYEDANGSDVIIVTAGKPRTPEMKSRMELLKVNKEIIRDVVLKLRDVGGEPIIITLTNPVDVMNYLMWMYTDLDRRRVLGSAGQLDSSRFRVVLSKRFKVPVLEVDAYVIGEHGDNQVPVFSRVKIKGEKRIFAEAEQQEIKENLRAAALGVISKKGATLFAPASNTADIVQSVLDDRKNLAVCSVVLDGEYGLSDVSIGVPVIVGRRGVEKIVEWDLEDTESTLFYRGAQRLKGVIGEILGS
ncbi:MAG: malate dehydrogenase [Candidatus Bathyarchaeia archaeon]